MDGSEPLLDPQRHARLCAFLLDEMPREDRAAFEVELNCDPALQAERVRLERTIDLVRGLRSPAPTLSAERRADLAKPLPRRRTVRPIAAAAAAVVALGGGALLLRTLGGEATGGAERTNVAGAAPTARSEGREVIRDVTREPPASEPIAEESAVLERAIRETVTPQTVTPETVTPETVPPQTVPPQTVPSNPVPPQPVADPGQPVLRWMTQLYAMTPQGEATAVPTDSTNVQLHLVQANGLATALPTGAQVRLPTVHGLPSQQDFTAGSDPAAATDFSGFTASMALGEIPTEPQFTPPGFDVFSVGSGAGGGSIALPRVPVDPDALFRSCRPRPGERPRDMYFRFWGDHAFVSTRTDALSTFAADVDTASFVLARRYLRDGILPERAQVRTEEFVNYFDPDLAPPADDDFAIHTELAPSPFGGSNARVLLRVGVRAREIEASRREALALTFVVDTSGSMREGQRLELVKHALLTLVSRLDGRDRIGIVAFSTDARLLLPMTPADARAEIAAVIQELEPNGSTNAEAGLKLGYDLAATALDAERHSRVVFLSDGVANVGQTDQDRIASDVRERRDAGILLNTIGVGMGNHNDVFLERLADQGDGICDYVDDSRAVQRAIVERFTGAFQPVAADVKIQVEFADGRVLRWRQLGYENRAVADQDFRNDAVDAGEVGSGHQVTALFELECATAVGEAVDDGATWATVRVRWMPPRRAGDDGRTREAREIERVVDGSQRRAAFDDASPGFRRAAVVAQFAEVLRRSTHAAGDSYATLKAEVQEVVRLPAFADDEDTAELVTLVQRAEELGAARAIERADLARAIDEYQRHQYLRHELASLGHEPHGEELEALRRQNDRLEDRIRDLLRRN